MSPIHPATNLTSFFGGMDSRPPNPQSVNVGIRHALRFSILFSGPVEYIPTLTDWGLGGKKPWHKKKEVKFVAGLTAETMGDHALDVATKKKAYLWH